MNSFVGPTSFVSQQSVALERLRCTFRGMVGSNVLDSLGLLRVLDHTMFELSAYVLSERLPPVEVAQTVRVTDARTVEWAAPATWWDHWKLAHRGSWWAGWFVRLRPAAVVWRKNTVHMAKNVTLTVNLDRYRSYPHSNLRLPDSMGDAVLVHTLDKQVAWEDEQP